MASRLYRATHDHHGGTVAGVNLGPAIAYGDERELPDDHPYVLAGVVVPVHARKSEDAPEPKKK